MTGPDPETAAQTTAPDAVFFLSDYGLRDEFVGVVHAVIRSLAPFVSVIDLTHEIAPFDVRGGATALVRARPYLGPGVVLAVVDPGVGGPRRAIALETSGGGGPRFYVGPDNGLLLPAAESSGGARRAVELGTGRGSGESEGGWKPSVSATFDGRDVFAPAVAALCNGASLARFGPPVRLEALVRLPDPIDEGGSREDGAEYRRSEVTWVDRFGNVQLAAAGPLVPLGARAQVVIEADDAADDASQTVTHKVRRVRSFSDLGTGEAGLIADANGHLALCVSGGSAAERFGVGPGRLVVLAW